MKKEKLSGLGSGLLLSLCLSFLVCIYAPLELYLTNISEFWIKSSEYVPACLIMFFAVLIAGIIGFTVVRLINKNLYDICLVIGGAVLLGMYIQGNFLIKNLPSMEGAKVDWGNYPAERIKSIIAFAVPIVIFAVLLIVLKSKKFRKAVSVESGVLLLLFAITLTTLFITTDTKSVETVIPTTKGEFDMSEDSNYIVFLLDAVDGQKLKNAVENRPEVKEALDGFTYYEDAFAAYPCTSRSIPLIFSGKWFENTESFKKYKNDAMINSPLIKSLEEKGYSIGIYEEKYELDKASFDNKFVNYFPSKTVYNIKMFEAVIKMGGIKFFPWDLKQFTWNVQKALTFCKKTETEYDNFTWSNTDFYNTVTGENPFTKSDTKCARYIHISGAHSPFQYDKDMNIKEGTYDDNIEACVTIIGGYVKALKENGYYDNTAIVILADHGYNGEDIRNELKRMNPVFMAKGFGEKHELKYSSAPISYIDLADALTRLSDGTAGDSIFDVAENEVRTRRALLYKFNRENHMWEITSDGKASDYGAMKQTGKNFDSK